MGKLFNWLAGMVALATTVYVLNTYSISRMNNGFNFKGPKSNTTITYNSGTGEIKNIYNNGKENIETRFGKNNNGFFGSIKDSSNDISGNFNPKTNKGSIDGLIGGFLGSIELDYDGTKNNSFSRWISSFEYLYDNKGIISGHKISRI